MRIVAVVTATRAEYGLLVPVIESLRKYESDDFKVELIVTGTHLSDSYGRTIDEIKKDGNRIDEIIEIPIMSNSAWDISHNQAVCLEKFTFLFMQKHYSGVVILGDRYETLSIAIAAGNTKTPIFHLCGGDTTEGALDEWIRHAITKISYLHFVTNEDSQNRVIQLGEDPTRVFNCGSTSIDNILNVANMSKEEALKSIGLDNCDYALCTYHPVTMNCGGVEEQMESFIKAIDSRPEIEFIVTKSNADQGGARINEILDNAALKVRNLHVFTSLGVKRYLSLMKHALFVFGNSSSGIIETPAFLIPTVNIGDRQKGRLKAESIIDCSEDLCSINMAIDKALSKDFRLFCKSIKQPYGNGNAGELISSTIFEVVSIGDIDIKKKFCNLKV